MKQIAWDILAQGGGIADTVFFDADMTKEQVVDALVHDYGFRVAIRLSPSPSNYEKWNGFRRK